MIYHILFNINKILFNIFPSNNIRIFQYNLNYPQIRRSSNQIDELVGDHSLNNIYFELFNIDMRLSCPLEQSKSSLKFIPQTDRAMVNR